MSKLTTAERNRLPDSAFGGPNRSYPVQDRAHAQAAKARASQAFNGGYIDKAEEENIDTRADKVLVAGDGKGPA